MASPMDTETLFAAGPPEEAQQQPEVVQTFSLNLINIIRTAQGQNGVKHGEYSRYRRHCKNKLKALYKTLKFQHGRTKFIKRKIDVNTIADARFLQIPIFNAERAWAYAKEFKKQIEGDMNLKKRRHLIARMVKAAAWGKELARLASQRCDARGCVEAQAYAAFLSGSALAEKEASWRKALALLTRSRHILTQLARSGGSAENQALYLQQIEDMEPTIRYCSYQLDRQGQAAPNEAQLLADAEQEEGCLPAAQLSAHLSSLASGGVAAVEATATSLEWQGQSIPVRQDRLKAAVQQVQALQGQLSACMETNPGEGGMDPRVALYDKVIKALGEARTAARLAIKASTAPEGDPGRAELVAAEGALTGLIAQKQVELAELQVAEAEARFALGLDKVSSVKGTKDRRDVCRPEEVVRYLDGLSRALAELADVGARAGGRAGETLFDQATAKSSMVRALRAYYTAHYLAKGGRALEAYALFGRAAEHAAAAKADQPAKADAARLAALVTAAGTFQSVSQAEYAAALAQKREGVETAVGGIALADAQQAQPTTAKWLLESLDSWEAFAGAKAARVYQLPYAMQAIPCRPIMLDTAASHLAYPTLEHRVRKEAKKGVLSSLGLGWAWGAKK